MPRFEEIRERSIIGFIPWRLDSQGTREINILTSLTSHPTPHKSCQDSTLTLPAENQRVQEPTDGVCTTKGKHSWAGSSVEEDLECVWRGSVIQSRSLAQSLFWDFPTEHLLSIQLSSVGGSPFHLQTPHLEHLDYYHCNIGLQSSFISSLLASISL